MLATSRASMSMRAVLSLDRTAPCAQVPDHDASRARPRCRTSLAGSTPERQPANGPDVTHFTLANGLEVVVIPDHRTPVVTHMVWYRVGSADETPGQVRARPFPRTPDVQGHREEPGRAASRRCVATIGGQENAFTSTDYTGYFQRVPRDQLKLMMEFEADRMTGLVLTDDVVLPERNVVLEEQN